MLGLSLSYKLDWVSQIVSIAKTAFKKLLEIILLSCLGWCSQLNIFNELQKRINKAVGSSRAASLDLLAYRQNVSSLSFLYRYCFGRCSPELGELVPHLYVRCRSTHYSKRLLDFSVTIPRCYSRFFLRTTTFWNHLPAECFPMTYDLNDSKFRVKVFVSFFVPFNSFPISF